MSACPRCGGALWARELPQGSGHACGTCGGVWLDTAAASHITRVLCSETLAHAEAGARVARHPVDTRGDIACPTCGAVAQRSLAGQARVEIDVCPAHGMAVIPGGCPNMFGATADPGHTCRRVLLQLSGKVPREV